MDITRAFSAMITAFFLNSSRAISAMLFLLSQCRRMMRRRQMPRDVIIRGESMLPALLPGDRHCVEYRGRSRLHDIVVVRLDSYIIIGCDDCSGCPHCHAMPCLAVKRVVAMEGDKVCSRKNGCSVVVPQGHVYLLGDNKRISFDSRHFGSMGRPGRMELFDLSVETW